MDTSNASYFKLACGHTRFVRNLEKTPVQPGATELYCKYHEDYQLVEHKDSRWQMK